jgi:hypothetical protein
MNGPVMLRILIAVLIILTAIGSLILSIRHNKYDIFIAAMGSIAVAVFFTYIFGVWDD